MFDAIEKVFDDVPSSAQLEAVATLGLSIRARRNNGLRTRSANGVDEGVRVIALSAITVPVRRCSTNSRTQEMSKTGPSVAIIRRGRPASSKAKCSLVVSPPARTAEHLRAAFFRAPGEYWWARTMVESISTCLISVSSDTACATCSHTPLRRHRENRMYTVCHFPNFFGRLRHGQPLRSIQRTASKNQRLSDTVRPGSLSLPGCGFDSCSCLVGQ